ncbi:hypothetical protein GTS_37560 [Gandjariella thermophila]|uniref:Uncharacterized protein n=1 Tax=Gandjariella thermophila TaxID=1931992 RepID=A0A4D4JDZ5_9PSEU|nr:hypothetical protein GTS_37560 [Gandjariella thermophila]
MDERELAEVFRAAVRDTPPASFDERDVVAASRRARARQRTAIVAGSTLGVAVLVGGAVAGADLLHGPAHEVASGPEQSTTHGRPPMNTFGLPVPGTPAPHSFPEATPEQGGGAGGEVGPRADGTRSGCGPVDRELAAALAGELPAAAAGGLPVAVDAQCPQGARAAGYLVRDGDDLGVFSVVLVPAGAQRSVTQFSGPGSSTTVSVTTRSGGQLTVVSKAQRGSTGAPFGDRVAAIAADLASRY